MTTRPVRVVAIDNHETVLAGIASLAARRSSELTLLSAVEDAAALDLNATPPDVVVLDLYLGRDDAVSTPWIPRVRAWGASVLLHTTCEFPVPLREAVAAGAQGLTLKNDGINALAENVLAVAAGEFACSSTLARALLLDPRLVARLTQREVEVVQGIDDGLTHRQIARRLDVEESTIKEHLKNVRGRYLKAARDLGNSHSLTREARRDGWL